MDRVDFICPACRGVVPAPASLAGESAPCPRCGADVERWVAPRSSRSEFSAVPVEPMPLPDPEPAGLPPISPGPSSRNWSQAFQRRRWILLAIAVVLIITVAYFALRSTRLSDPTVGDVVQFFGKSGLEGSFSPWFVSLINAKEGGIYQGVDFEMDIIRFEDESQAKSLEKTGFGDHPCHRNGKIILVIHKGDEQKITSIFKRF